MQAETKQMRLVDPILMELDQEAEITKRLLDVIPEEKLSWRPHPKARSLGELAIARSNVSGQRSGYLAVGDKRSRDLPNRSGTDQPGADTGSLCRKSEKKQKTSWVRPTTHALWLSGS
jgi:hypothetical protein